MKAAIKRLIHRLGDAHTFFITATGAASKVAKYSEDQERVPAGEPGGGEFAGGAGAGEAEEKDYVINSSKYPKNEKWVRSSLDNLPESHQDMFTRGKLIIYVKAETPEGTSGYTDSSDKPVRIYMAVGPKGGMGTYGKGMFQDTFVHELGHAAYAIKMTAAERTEWKGIAETNAKALESADDHSKMRLDGESDVREHFAEAYRLYVTKESKLAEKAPQVHVFFQKVFGKDITHPSYKSVAAPALVKVSAVKLLNAGKPAIHPGVLHPASVAAEHALRHEMEKVFAEQRKLALAVVEKFVKTHHAWMQKRESGDDLSNDINAALDPTWENLPANVQAAIEQAVNAGATAGLAQFQVHDSNMIAAVNRGARDWARDRAAEMVGMKWTDAGDLVDNPHAEWVISDTTRDRIKNVITDAFSAETDMADIRNAIMDALREEPIFSEARAAMIAHTEVAFAQTSGNFLAWEETGLVRKVTSLLSADHEIEDECDDAADEVVVFGEPFSNGMIMPPFHPNCECVLVAAVIDDEEAPPPISLD